MYLTTKIMNLYTRQENDKEIVIIYKYRAISYYLLIPFFIGLFLRNSIGNALETISFLGMLLVIILTWSVRRETSKALRDGKTVQISGNKFSFSDPVIVRILKKSPSV